MAQTYRQRLLALLVENERSMRALFGDLSLKATAILRRYAGTDGTIPPEQQREVRRQVEALLTSYFLARSSQGDMVPYEERGDVVIPLSPYMLTLWPLMKRAGALGVSQQEAIITRALRPAPDVARAYLPMWRGEMTQRVLRYDPLHLWVDPNGYTLSARIWRNTGNARRQLDAYLAEAMGSGKDVFTIAREMDDFLLPGRKLRRTTTPYGRDVSYDAMRLARTEIAAAQSRAMGEAARANPFVAGYEIVLSERHPKPDICDTAAAGGPYSWDDPSAPHAPLHAQCLCYERNTLKQSRAEVIAQLRQQLGAGEAPLGLSGSVRVLGVKLG